VKRFSYWRDPLCLLACTGYAINRWLIPAALKGLFLRGYFADMLLIPAALPPMLGLERWLRLRTDDSAPRWFEILFHFAIWSIAAELIGPFLFRRATADPMDVAVYAVGALVAGLWWRRAK